MRTYWLQAELSGDKWDLGPYGLTPFLPSKRELTRGITFDKTSDYTFIANGEDYKQPTFVGNMVFKGRDGISGFERYQRFVEFTAQNTTKNFKNLFKNAFYHGGQNVVKKLRLYSKEDKFHERFCYVSLQNVTGLKKMGPDYVATVTFSMQSLWLIKKTIPFDKIRTKGTASYVKATINLTEDDFGDTDIIVGIYTSYLATDEDTAKNISLSAISPDTSAVWFMEAPAEQTLSYSPGFTTLVRPLPGGKYEMHPFIIGEVFGQYTCAESISSAGGYMQWPNVVEGYKRINHNGTAKLKVSSYIRKLVLSMPNNIDGEIFWYKKYFGE